tara:strand:+ start:491 stop:772 length:282 start_codon:yes stop_codon:yes gene_type:complete
MTLSFETTHEYYMKDPGMYYCAEHNGLCISQDYEDTVRFTGVEEKTIIKFVSGLFKHNAELAASLKKEIGLQDVKATSTTSKQRKTKSSVEAA